MHCRLSKYERIFADDLAILGNSCENVSQKYARWKEALKSRGLKVIIKKTIAIKIRVKTAKVRLARLIYVAYVAKQ